MAKSRNTNLFEKKQTKANPKKPKEIQKNEDKNRKRLKQDQNLRNRRVITSKYCPITKNPKSKLN